MSLEFDPSSFKYSNYLNLLNIIKENNRNLSFADLPLKSPVERYFILRHVYWLIPY